ncbi:MAG: HepT-like ribonuclease domain-containing protein [Acidimicrobiales bacterium]
MPWEDIAGFRNRMVHGYLGVNLDIVWDILERDLPPLARMARAELALRNQRGSPARERDTGLGPRALGASAQHEGQPASEPSQRSPASASQPSPLGGIRTPNLLIRRRRPSVAVSAIRSRLVASRQVEPGADGSRCDGLRLAGTRRDGFIGSNVGSRRTWPKHPRRPLDSYDGRHGR